MNTYKSFETERLLLLPISEKDAPFILELFNSPKWLKYIGDRDIKTIEKAKDYIETKMIPQLEKLGFSNYIVIRKMDGVKIGVCGLYDRCGLEGIDIGFAFLPQYEKMGYAFESANKIKEIAISYFGIKQISAITTKENIASQSLIGKIGFQFIETIKILDDREELLLYKLEVS
jgi:ribosomal-protein-alanine N-acetyltransferase